MRHKLAVLLASLRMSIQTELQYRANFFVQVLNSVLNLVVALGGVFIVFQHTESVNGWTAPGVEAVVGVFLALGGILRASIQPSLQRFMESIQKGTLDFVLTKPIDSQWMVSMQRFDIWSGLDVLLGAAVLGHSLVNLHAQLTVAGVAAFAVSLICGALLVYCLFMCLATVTFWLIKAPNILEIFNGLYEAGRWPVGIYPAWLRVILTYLVPLGVAITLPVEALSGEASFARIGTTVVVTAAALVGTRLLWGFGLRHYSGASA